MLRLCISLLSLVTVGTAAARLETGTDPQARLPFWQWQDKHVSFRWVQRLPDQTRGFFMARKFNAAQADEIANSCIFQTIIKNISPAAKKITVSYDLYRWSLRHKSEERGIRTLEKWMRYWESRNVPASAKIAFRWALIPDRQSYRSEDYNWGMTSFGLPPGAVFNLRFYWEENGKKRQGKIKGIRCAADIHPDPSEFQDR